MKHLMLQLSIMNSWLTVAQENLALALRGSGIGRRVRLAQLEAGLDVDGGALGEVAQIRV